MRHEPTHTTMCVRMPAAHNRRSRSKPMMLPRTAAVSKRVIKSKLLRAFILVPDWLIRMIASNCLGAYPPARAPKVPLAHPVGLAYRLPDNQ